MLLSLAVLLVPIALVIGFYRVVLDGDAPVVVDPRPAVAEARAAAAFDVGEPTGLGDDWHVVTASFRRVDGGATLRIGYLAPKDQPVQLVQSSAPLPRLIAAELGAEAAPRRGAVRVGTRSWQRYAARSGENALLLLEKGRTVIIVGTAPEPELRRLAEALP